MTSFILKFPREIRFRYQVFSKQMGKTFLWRKSTKVKCHMSGEGISNVIHPRQKQCGGINWLSEIPGVNTEKEPERSGSGDCCLPLLSPVSKVHLLWDASIRCWKRTPKICFHPLQKNLCFHEFSVRPNMSSLLLSVTKGGILSAVFIGTEFVFAPLYVNASHFKLLFSLDTLGFSAQIAYIPNPLDCRPDDWARESPLSPRFMSQPIEVEIQTFHPHHLSSLDTPFFPKMVSVRYSHGSLLTKFWVSII